MLHTPAAAAVLMLSYGIAVEQQIAISMVSELDLSLYLFSM